MSDCNLQAGSLCDQLVGQVQRNHTQLALVGVFDHRRNKVLLVGVAERGDPLLGCAAVVLLAKCPWCGTDLQSQVILPTGSDW